MTITDIIVVARKSWPEVWYYSIDELYDYHYQPHISTEPPGGAFYPSEISYDFHVECSSAAAAAKAIGDKVWNDMIGSGAYEFTGTVVAGYGGKFQIYRDKIWSLTDTDMVTLHLPPDGNALVIVHSHPLDWGGNSADREKIDLWNRYPSSTDWNNIESLISANPHLVGASIGILSPFNEMRLFPMSQRAYFLGLTKTQMESGIGLPPLVPSGGCA